MQGEVELILCSATHWRSSSHYVFIREQYITRTRIVRTAARRIFTLIRKGPGIIVASHNFRQFGNEQNKYNIVRQTSHTRLHIL